MDSEGHVPATDNAAGAQTQPPPDNSASVITIDDLAMPMAVVKRIARRRLPATANVQKDAMIALARCATMTVSYLANAANERAHESKRKTIGVSDVLAGLKDSEFGALVPILESHLEMLQQGAAPTAAPAEGAPVKRSRLDEQMSMVQEEDQNVEEQDAEDQDVEDYQEQDDEEVEEEDEENDESEIEDGVDAADARLEVDDMASEKDEDEEEDEAVDDDNDNDDDM